MNGDNGTPKVIITVQMPLRHCQPTASTYPSLSPLLTYHVFGALIPEENLRHNAASYSGSGTNKKGHNGTAGGHGRVCLRFGAANVSCHTANEGKKENWASSPTVCKWSPKQRGTSEDWELERRDVSRPVNAHTKVFRYRDE
jgi:hypothetical protein